MTVRNEVIFATVKVPGFHYWPAPTDRRVYLGSMHRHIFGVTATVSVHHDERDVEFHDLQNALRMAMQREADETFPDGLMNFGGKSCETMARGIGYFLAATFGAGDRAYEVEVNEDGECGARVTFMPNGGK